MLTLLRYYLGTMLTQAGITDTTTQLEINIYLSVWCLFTAILGTSLADKIGRKKLGAGSLSISLIFLYLVGAFTKCKFSGLPMLRSLLTKIVYGSGENKSGIYATVACIFLYQGSQHISRAMCTAPDLQ